MATPSAQVFSPRATFIARASLIAFSLAVATTAALAYGFIRSSFYTGVGYEVPQTVPFSHHHHVTGIGIDCRYCHPAAETSAFAGMPTTQVCMNCHSRIWTNAAVLQPVRDSWSSGIPLRWERVHNLPDFVYFDHSIHLNKGIGCSTCHGPVNQMRLIRKEQTLFMAWCLDCHRDPAPYIRPPGELYTMDWTPKPQHSDPHSRSIANETFAKGLTDCSACHR
jgi:hypothetical protein